MNKLVCPNCDSNKILRGLHRTIHFVQDYNEKLDVWYDIQEPNGTDAFIYFCDECNLISYTIDDFQQNIYTQHTQ